MNPKKMKRSTKRLCLTSMGVALFAVLSMCLQVPVFENYYLCFGYVVMTFFCYYFGALGGMTVGFFGVIVYCLLTSGLRGLPGWSLGNLLIGIAVGITCMLTRGINKRWLRYAIIGISIVISCGVAMLGAKSVIESLIYSQPLLLRTTKNFYAFVADAVVMIAGLPICVSLEEFMRKYVDC